MKKLLLLLLTLISINVVIAQSKNKKKEKQAYVMPIDEKNGFKVFQFGGTVEGYRESLSHLVLGKDTIFQVINPEYLKIGDIDIDKFNIITTEGVIYAIMFEVKGHAQDIKDIFIEAYGDRYSTPNRFMARHVWEGKKVTLSYDYNEITNIISCTMIGLDALKISQERDAIKNKERSKDL